MQPRTGYVRRHLAGLPAIPAVVAVGKLDHTERLSSFIFRQLDLVDCMSNNDAGGDFSTLSQK